MSSKVFNNEKYYTSSYSTSRENTLSANVYLSSSLLLIALIKFTKLSILEC